MQVFICDPGLRDELSHHYNYVRLFADELSKLKYRIKIYAHLNVAGGLREKLSAIPHFEHHTYHYHGGEHHFDEEVNWLLGNESFRGDMTRLDGEIAQRNAIVIVPAVTQHQIDGLARWYEALTEERRPKLAVSLMFAPQWTAWGPRAVRGPEYYARAIERLKPWLGKSVLLYTETPEASSYFQQLTDVPILVGPIPWVQSQRLSDCRPNGRTLFAYLGHSRKEKGFHLLPKAIGILRSEGAQFDVVVQIAPNNVEPLIVSANEELCALSDVTIIAGALAPDQHNRVLASCDAVLLPYDPDMYRLRGSALFAEAIALGKPLIVSAGTVMEAAARRGECVARICNFNAADLARAMREVCSDFEEMNAQANIAARRWREANDFSEFCRTISFAAKRVVKNSRTFNPRQRRAVCH